MMRYIAGNRKPKVLAGKRHIACVGDSITFGHGVGGREELTWEFFLNELIEDDYQVINYGASGRTLQQVGDHPYTADRIFRHSLACRAEIYLILLGSNDAKSSFWNRERFEREYELFIERYTTLENRPQVVLLTPPCCYPISDSGMCSYGISAKNLQETVEAVRTVAAKRGLPLIDLYEATQGHPEWFADGVHPNAEGNRAIAEYLARQLKL